MMMMLQQQQQTMTTKFIIFLLFLSLLLLILLLSFDEEFVEATTTTTTTSSNNIYDDTDDDRKTDINKPSSSSSSFVIGGYLPDYRSYINVNATATHLTDLILFSIQPTLDNTNKCCLGSHHYRIARKAKSFKKKEESSEFSESGDSSADSQLLKVWITIGGGGRTNELPQIMSNPTLRTNFIQYVAVLAKRESIDGIDWNFYHPKLIELGLLLSFLEEASEVWKEKHGLLISLALPPNVVLPIEYYNIIDRTNLMTYDMIYTHGEYHASMSNTKKAVHALIKSGCPRPKIILGIPAYGRDIINFNEVQTFAEIYDDVFDISGQDKDADNKEEWINKIQSSWNNNKMAWESPNMIKEKVDFVLEEKLGGIFIWELGQDKQLNMELELQEGNNNFGYGGILLQSAANAVATVATTTTTSTGSSENSDDGIIKNKNEEEL